MSEGRDGSEGPAPDDVEPLVLALDVADAALHDRLARLLGAVPGLRLVTASADDAADGLADRADVVVTVASGERAPMPAGPSSAGPPDGVPELTPRELEVLDVLAEGASNREIAGRLGISVHTAKFHVGSILDKLDSVGRTDAVAYALRAGVLRL